MGDVPLDSVNSKSEGADEAFLRFLRSSLTAPAAAAAAFKPGAALTSAAFTASLPGSKACTTTASRLVSGRLRLTTEAVAKVVPRGVTHLDMAPYDPSGPLVVAAGDKDGNVGLWRVDQLSESAGGVSDGDGTEDGVLFYRPHGSYVCHLKWGRGGLAGKLITAGPYTTPLFSSLRALSEEPCH